MKATEQYFPVVLFILPYKVVLIFESVYEILQCDHLNETITQNFPLVLFIMLYKVVLTADFVDEVLKSSSVLNGLHQFVLSHWK